MLRKHYRERAKNLLGDLPHAIYESLVAVYNLTSAPGRAGLCGPGSLGIADRTEFCPRAQKPMSTTNAPSSQGQPHPVRVDELDIAGHPIPPAHASASGAPASNRMSYKFQRLREKLRHAVTSGELSGKLPGERALAKRFHVNAKTLSKALTDLAAEGLLDRSIGRGTYVKGTAPTSSAPARWLVLCDDPNDSTIGCLLEELRRAHPDFHVALSASVAQMRP